MNIRYQITDLKLVHPFKIARRAVDELRQVISVEIDGGLGETAPARFYGETVETVQVAFDILDEGLDGNLDAIESVMSELESVLGRNYAAKSAIDMALPRPAWKKVRRTALSTMGTRSNGDAADNLHNRD